MTWPRAAFSVFGVVPTFEDEERADEDDRQPEDEGVGKNRARE